MRKTVTTYLWGILFFFTLLLSGSKTILARESQVWKNKETGYYIYLEDEADLLTSSEEQTLMKQMEQITAYGNVAFVSVSSNPEYSTSRYAEKYYEENFGYSSGIVFLIDMEERILWIYSDGQIHRIITTAYANTITDNVYTYASRQEYLSCASKAFEQVYSLLSGHRIAQPMKYISNALLSIVIALIINYFLAMTLSRARKASTSQLLGGTFYKAEIKNPQTQFVKQTKRYSPQNRSSSGGVVARGGSFGGGGGFRGGGGGGHRF